MRLVFGPDSVSGWSVVSGSSGLRLTQVDEISEGPMKLSAVKLKRVKKSDVLHRRLAGTTSSDETKLQWWCDGGDSKWRRSR